MRHIWKSLLIPVLACLAGSTVLSETVPFDPIRGLVEIDVKINGHIEGSFGVDTGADKLYIDRTFASKNELKLLPGPRRDVVGADGVSTASNISLRSIEVAGETLYNVRATGIDIPNLVRDKRSGNPDGLIGYDILRRFFITVDYPDQALTLETSQPRFLNGRKYEEIPFDIHQHLIMVDVIFDEEIEATLILDYCASYTSLSHDLAERLGFEPDGERFQRIDRIRLGEETVTENVPVVVTDLSRFNRRMSHIEIEGILGASFLYPHKVTIDYKREKVYIHH